MYCDGEIETMSEACSLNALYLAPIDVEAYLEKARANNANTSNLTKPIRTIYSKDKLLQAIIKAKQNS